MRAPAFWWRKQGGPQAALLAPFAAAYGVIAAQRLRRPGRRASIPVICIGNPTVGGAGKTPAAIAAARFLAAAGERPMLLSRGYGGRLHGPVMVDAAVHGARDVGDEPLLLARAAPTIVSRDRPAGARLAHESGASAIVMDDGFQNPSLAKDLSVLVVDGRRGLGNGRVFPAGPLRAPLEAQLARADALLLVGDASGAATLARAARARGMTIFHARLEPDREAIAGLAGRRVLAFAGIGDPEKFFAALAAAGIDVAARRSFPDHHVHTAAEAGALLRDAERDGLTLATTEKDHVRLQGDALAPLAARTRVVPVALIIEEADDFRRLLVDTVRRPRDPTARAPDNGV